jgi:5-methylcytosine-specific restriction endonuclease McrA
MDCIRGRATYRGPKKVACTGCGKLCVRSSRRPIAVTCLECRRAQPGYRPHWQPGHLDPRACVACLSVYTPNHPQSLTCSPACAKERKRTLRRNQARYRRELVALSADLPDFLTADRELAMRRKAKRCPMPGCGVELVDAPFLPNSKELDHIVPRVMGGAHTMSNTRVICRSCNVRRPDDGSDVVSQLDLFATVRLCLRVRLVLRLMPRPVPRRPAARRRRVVHGQVPGARAYRPLGYAWPILGRVLALS